MKLDRRRTLTLWERAYIGSIVVGLWVTTKHFLRNLGLHVAHRFGLFRHIRADVTVRYPEQMRRTAPRLRTRHRLTQRVDGSPRCVGCMMCETVCPAKCIYIVAAEHPDPDVEKYPASFDLDLGKCVYCGYCVEACPEDAIRMDTQIHDIASYTRDGMWLNIHELLNPRSTDLLNGPVEKFATYALPSAAAASQSPE